MARAHAANACAQSDSIKGLAQSIAKTAYHRLMVAETALRGISLDGTAALTSAIATSFGDARPLAHNAFKVDLAQRAVLRAVQTAGARA